VCKHGERGRTKEKNRKACKQNKKTTTEDEETSRKMTASSQPAWTSDMHIYKRRKVQRASVCTFKNGQRRARQRDCWASKRESLCERACELE